MGFPIPLQFQLATAKDPEAEGRENPFSFLRSLVQSPLLVVL